MTSCLERERTREGWHSAVDDPLHLAALCQTVENRVVRPKDESGPMHLEFLVRYEAFPEEPCTLCCRVGDVVEVSLPAGATIEERITRRFGDRKVPLRELLAPNRVIPRHRL